MSDYTVEISRGGVESFLENYRKHIIVDENVHKQYPALKLDSSILLTAVEENKTLFKVSDLIESLRSQGANRTATLAAIGGGITQDISTFCASSYMRGIDWVYVPTTLLGMVDSCIGGKSSLNVGQYKNLAGNFFPPQNIFIDVDFCRTLTEQQLAEGLCEGVKICYAYSDEAFDKYLSLSNLDDTIHELEFEDIVSLCLKTKKKFVEEDEFDEGIRLLLNFGHTFGHAIEGACNFSIPHGIAVGLGMVCAYKVSLMLGLIETNNTKVLRLLRYVSVLLKYMDGLDEILENMDVELALQNFLSDKKHSDNGFVMILYDNEGGLVRKEIEQSKENKKMVLDAFSVLKKHDYEI